MQPYAADLSSYESLRLSKGTPIAFRGEMTLKIIMDVDTGDDDAVALLMAGHSPELELVGVTVVHGNADLPTTVRNTLATLDAGGLSNVPVYAGADRPLSGPPPPREPVQQRRLPLPEPRMASQSMTASEFLAESYGKGGNETLLVPTGPLTNVALALQREPALAERIPRIVMMGGAYAEGNVTPSAEFNIYADPEAARIVFQSGIPITMVGLEVTAQALVTMEDAERIRELDTPASRVAAGLIAEEVQWFVDHLGWSGGQIYDACAVAACIEPDVITTQAMHVDIELHGELTRGRTVCDSTGLHGRAPNVDVGVAIDRDRFLALMMRSLAGQ